MGSLIRAANLAGIEELMTQLGGDAQALLQRFHIDPALIRDPDAYISYKSMSTALERAAIECDCPDFGLRLVNWQGLNMLGPVAVMARNADTVLDAFSSLARFLHVHGPALKLSLRERAQNGDYCFNYRIDEPGLLAPKQSYELSLANGVNILRMLAGSSSHPARVYLMHAPLSSRATYTQAFGCPVEFGSEHCGFDLRAADMHRPLVDADLQTRHMAQRFLESAFTADSTVAERVTELIHRLLATGHCSIATIAENMAMHPRTLQRSLKETGDSYEALLDEIRKEKAQHYLTQTSMRFSQVSALLGYTDQSTFNRASRRWFGHTPKEVRRTLSINQL